MSIAQRTAQHKPPGAQRTSGAASATASAAAAASASSCMTPLKSGRLWIAAMVSCRTAQRQVCEKQLPLAPKGTPLSTPSPPQFSGHRAAERGMLSGCYRRDGREVRGVEQRGCRVHLCCGENAGRSASHRQGRRQRARADAPRTGPPSSAGAPQNGGRTSGRGTSGAPSATAASGAATTRQATTGRTHRRSTRRRPAALAMPASCASASFLGLETR